MANPVPQPVDTPQFAVPFHLNPDGSVACVEQDSAEDVAGCVRNVLVCPAGFKLGDPGFGVQQPLFAGVPLNTNMLLQAVQKLEPRANYSITDVADAYDASVRNVRVRVQDRVAPTTSS